MTSRVWRRVIALGIAMPLVQGWPVRAQWAYAQAQPPVVGTEFTVEASVYTDNLDDATVLDLERAIGVHLSEVCERHFKFLGWTGLPAEDPTTQVDTRLTVSLVGEPHPLGARIALSYSGTVDGQPVDLPDITNKVIYEAFDDQNAHAPARLRRDVIDTLSAQFANQDFRLLLQKQFLKTIPLIDKIHVDVDNQRLVIPIAWDSLRASDQSVLLVSFVAAPPPHEQKSGTIRLMPDGRASVGGVHGLVRAAILFYDFPPELLEQWHPEIPMVLSHVVAGGLAIFMEKYDPDTSPAGTSRGLIIDPEGM